MSNTNTSASGGIGFTGALTVLFIGLKLWGKIDWSWWWVLAPSWIPLAFALIVMGFVLLIFMIKLLMDRK